MHPTEFSKDLGVLLGEGSTVSLLAQENLDYVDKCLKEKSE
jgi:hypothetical protein